MKKNLLAVATLLFFSLLSTGFQDDDGTVAVRSFGEKANPMSDPAGLADGNTSPKRPPGVRIGLRLRRMKALAIQYWWILAATITLGLAVEGCRCLQQVVLYVSTSKMMVNGHVSIPQGETYTEELAYFYGTQVALMKSQATLTESVARVRAMHSEITVDESATVSAAQEPGTAIFDLQVTSANPEYAKLLLDAVMDTYLALKRDRKDQTTNGAVAAITEEIAHLEKEIQDDEEKLLDFQKQNNVAFIEEQSNSAGTFLLGLNNELAQLTKEHDLLSLQSRDSPPNPSGSDDSQQEDAGAAPDANANDSITAEQDVIAKLKILRDQYSVYLKDKHPKMVALSDSIDKEEKFLAVLKSRSLQQREAYRQDLELRIKNLGQEIAEWNAKTLDLSQRLATYEQLKGKVTREESLYNLLASSMQNVNLNKSLDQEDISILEAASSPYALSPDYLHQLTLGLFGGLLGGVAILYFINRLDDRIRSSFDLENKFGFPIVGQVPLALVDKQNNRAPLLAERDQRHVLVESLRNIRSYLVFCASGTSKPQSLLVSSAVPGEGKSTLISNLAITFALSGARVLLVDADMRRGVLHSLFDVPVSPGLSNYLRQQVSWRKIVQKTKFSTLDLIPRGKIPHDAGDLLLGPTVDLLLHESVGEYDLVLWDSAPLLATDDAANLCSKVEGILLVARVGHSSSQSIHSALEALSQRNGNICGIVVNGVEPDQPGYYERYKYKEYYAAGAEI